MLKLGGHLGQTLKQLRDNLGLYDDIPEEYLWMAWWHFSPFGDEQRMQARQMAILANCHRDPKRKPTPFWEEDFMQCPKQVKEQTGVEQELMFRTALGNLKFVEKST